MESDEKRGLLVLEFCGQQVAQDPIIIDQRRRQASHDIDFDVEMNKFCGPEFMSPDWQGPEPTELQIREALNRRLEAQDILMPVWYKMFDQKPLTADGSGVTATEILDALATYLEFSTGVKKNTELMPNSEQPIPESTLIP